MKMQIDIDNEMIKGLLCSAFEGGSNYWAMIQDYEIVKGSSYEDFRKGGKYQTKNYWHPCQIVPLHEGCAVIVKDNETKKLHKLDMNSIHNGFKVMRNKYPEHFSDFMNQNDDAITGDVFLQCCLFGDVVYG